MFWAKALYSNVADCAEELSFSQGDIIEVIEKDFDGLSGWWLCIINGRRGIAPGNRLQPLVGEHGNNSSPNGNASNNTLSKGTKVSTTLDTRNDGCRRESQRNLNDTRSSGSDDVMNVYDVPRRLLDDYDVPSAHTSVVEQRRSTESSSCDIYDRPSQQIYDIPSAVFIHGPLPGSNATINKFNRNVYDSPSAALSSSDMSRVDSVGLYDCPSSYILSSAMNNTTLTSYNNLGNYEVPPGSGMSQGDYQVPSGSVIPLGDYEVPAGSRLPLPSSNRSSVLSTGSNDALSARSSTCMSARSSAEVPVQDLYDIVPPARPVNGSGHGCSAGGGQFDRGSPRSAASGASPRVNGLMAASCERGRVTNQKSANDTVVLLKSDPSNCTCITPVPSAARAKTTAKLSNDNRDSLLDDYSIPRSDSSTGSSSDSGISSSTSPRVEQSIYDVPPNSSANLVTEESLYDSPRPASSGTSCKQPMNRAMAIFAQVAGQPLYDVPSPPPQTAEPIAIPLDLSKKFGTNSPRAILGGSKESEFGNRLASTSASNSSGSSSLITRHVTLAESVDERKPSKPPPPAVKPKPKLSDSNLQALKMHEGLRVRPLPSPPPTSSNTSQPSTGGLKPLAAQRLMQQCHGGNGSKADVSVLVCSSVSSLAEWNDDCDYVTIASNAESELKRDILGGSSASFSSCLMNEQYAKPAITTTTAAVNDSGTMLSHRFKERLEAIQKSQSGGHTDDTLINGSSSSSSTVPQYSTGTTVDDNTSVSYSQVITYYAAQADIIFAEVRAAADNFFISERIPGAFAPRARAVVLAAHKLVYISDAMTRALMCDDDDNDIAVAGNALCDSLKAAVTAIKFAVVARCDISAMSRMEDCMMGAVSGAVELVDVIRAYAARCSAPRVAVS